MSDSPKAPSSDPAAGVVAFPRPAPFADADEELAFLRAEVARLTRRLAEVELIADRDPLTPALNRRAFVRELSRALAFQARYGGEAAVIYFDLDRLKAINDAHGHAAGDAAIQQVIAVLADGVRESDVVGRLGGDEFAVLLARAPLEDALAKAASLAAAVTATPLVHEGRSLPLSVSYGVRALEAGRDAAQTLAEADAAMYLAKAARRS